MYEDLIDASLGKIPVDLLIKNGQMLNVHTRETYEANVGVYKDRIVYVGPEEPTTDGHTKIIDAKGLILIPGFIDAHIHIESSMMAYTQFAKAVLPHGTTAVITDLHEVGIVLGLKGIRYVLDEAKKTPVKAFWKVPSHIPFAPGMETTGAIVGPEDIKEALTWEEAVGLAEVIVPSIVQKNPDLLKAVGYTIAESKILEGHAPATRGRNLIAYSIIGIRSDHESTTAEEALEKLRVGIDIMIREGSVSHDLKGVIKLITEYKMPTHRCMLVTDDETPIDVANLGHMDYKIRYAISEGVDPIDAIQMATINPARHFNIDHLVGSISPGRYADIVAVSSLDKIDIKFVVANGELYVEDGKLVKDIPLPDYPDWLTNTINVGRELTEADFDIKHSKEKGTAKVRVIGVKDGTLLKDALEAELPIVDYKIQVDPEKDILKIAVIERHKATGNIGLGFVSGFGLKEGAIGTTVAHDNHNISIVGTNNRDMMVAANHLIKIRGGMVVVKDGKILGDLPLPIAGLMSPEPCEKVKEMLENLHKLASDLGCKLTSPFMTLAFTILPAIPAYGITDMGLVDVFQFKLVSPIIS
ncbi:MAG: adenine deaminase [Thaumarchaeota archaeon]|nr:MAG: adenine deaminase [Nitrososphaerota archaeon]